MIKQLLKLLKIKFAGEIPLKDGTLIRVDGDMTVGATVYVQSPDGEIPLPDGDYELESGEILSAKDGKIEAIVDVVDTEEAPDVIGETPVSEIVAPMMTKEVKLPIVEPVIEPVIEPLVVEERVEVIDNTVEIKASIEALTIKFNEELEKLRSEVEFIKQKTLVVELKKNKIIENETISRFDVIKNLKNNK